MTWTWDEGSTKLRKAFQLYDSIVIANQKKKKKNEFSNLLNDFTRLTNMSDRWLNGSDKRKANDVMVQTV